MTETIRSRREPPAFRRATVAAVADRSPRLRTLTLTGPDLAGLDIGLPASSVRLLVPEPGAAAVTLPIWNGNEFLRADGTRPPIRTLTPVRFDRATNALDVEVVLHGDGPLSSWAAGDPLGDPTAISGTGRGYTIDPDAHSFVLAGDESAVPAIGVILATLPDDVAVTVLVEAVVPVAEVPIGDHPGSTIDWLPRRSDDRPGDALLDAISSCPLDDEVRVWVAGEAAGVQRIRHHLFDERGIPRSHAAVRGYWKVERSGEQP